MLSRTITLSNDFSFSNAARGAYAPAPQVERLVVVLVLMAALLSGCGTFGSGGGDTNDDSVPGEVTPTASGVYTNDWHLHVRLEPRDESEGAVKPNDHPVELKPAQIRRWLGDLEVRPEEGNEPVPLIPDQQLPELSVLMAQALGDARPDQDVVFHSFRRAGSWFGSERRATTARVFYRDNALNLIFGELDDFYSEQIDRDLQPLKPGFRGASSDTSGELIGSPQVAFVDGRADWIRLDRSAIVAAPVAARSAPISPAIAAPAEPAQRDPRWSQLEERLLILDGLRSKGLITEKDYEIKKRELLEVLDL